MALGEQRISGATYDLSGLGSRLSEWQTLRFTVRDSHITLYLNDQEVYKGKLENDVGKVVGLRYRFHGPGAVDYIQLSHPDGRIAFSEDYSLKVSSTP
jgi:hypothetical protein